MDKIRAREITCAMSPDTQYTCVLIILWRTVNRLVYFTSPNPRRYHSESPREILATSNWWHVYDSDRLRYIPQHNFRQLATTVWVIANDCGWRGSLELWTRLQALGVLDSTAFCLSPCCLACLVYLICISIIVRDIWAKVLYFNSLARDHASSLC